MSCIPLAAALTAAVSGAPDNLRWWLGEPNGADTSVAPTNAPTTTLQAVGQPRGAHAPRELLEIPAPPAPAAVASSSAGVTRSPPDCIFGIESYSPPGRCEPTGVTRLYKCIHTTDHLTSAGVWQWIATGEENGPPDNGIGESMIICPNPDNGTWESGRCMTKWIMATPSPPICTEPPCPNDCRGGGYGFVGHAEETCDVPLPPPSPPSPPPPLPPPLPGPPATPGPKEKHRAAASNTGPVLRESATVMTTWTA